MQICIFRADKPFTSINDLIQLGQLSPVISTSHWQTASIDLDKGFLATLEQVSQAPLAMPETSLDKT